MNDAAAAAADGVHAGLKQCSSCTQLLAESAYSSAQLKRKGKRKCARCVGDATTPVAADAEQQRRDNIVRMLQQAEAGGNKQAKLMLEELGNAATGKYWGETNQSGQPHGRGLRLSAEGEIIEEQCGEWAEGKLLKKQPIPRAAVPKNAPLKKQARPAERLYPDGSWFCWLDRAAGTGTLFHADGSEKRSGYEIHLTADGPQRYDGAFVRDQRHGLGRLVMSVRPTPKEAQQENGPIGQPREVVLFEGQWNNNQPLRGRQINWKKNEVYDGYFDHWGGYSGSGSLTLADGSLYRGKFRAGMRNGRGCFSNAITGHVLDGNWEANMMQGFGAEWSKEGKLLQLGMWQDNELQTEQPIPASALYDKHGWTERAREKATLFYPDGSWYEGPLDPTQRFPHGAGGQRYNADGSLRESGSFEYGSLHSSQRWRPESLEGNGLSSTGVVHARHTRHRWEGNVLHGKAHGYGEMKYVRETERNTAEESTAAADASATASPAARSSEGASLSPFAQQPRSEFSRYSGHAASGSCFGNGRMEYASGHVYEGAFRDDRHGVGYLLFPDGSLHCGQWSSGRASGLGISWSADGTRRACGWFEEGALVQSQSIPRSLVTDDRFLSKQERGASLLFPDGRYFVGPLPTPLAPRLHGTLYDAQHRVLHAGAFSTEIQLHALPSS